MEDWLLTVGKRNYKYERVKARMNPVVLQWNWWHTIFKM
jgi:hypothetical protein